MKLAVVSYKECWPDPHSPSGYSTVGGFPFQMQALSELFDATALILPEQSTPLPNGAKPLTGRSLNVRALPAPTGSDFRRKLALLMWTPRYLPLVWREIREADAVHAPVPGDIGLLGILISLWQRKPLFVRHCGTWGDASTPANRFLAWLLPRIAGGRTVVMATGGAETPPSDNPAVRWIFSTSLTEKEIDEIAPATTWRQGNPLRLVTVGRLTSGKNVQASIRALVLLCKEYPDTSLHIVGDGPQRARLELLVSELGLDKDVTFYGNISHDEALRILSDSHLFLFPTRVAEGFPKAALEAMAAGLPVIAPPVSVLSNLLDHGRGILLSDTQPETIAETVLTLIENEAIIADVGAKARAASRDYTLERWGQAIAERLSASWGPLRKGETSDWA